MEYKGVSGLPNLDPTSLLFGSYSPATNKTILMPSKNWLSFYSKAEAQHGVYFDTYGCVSFSALNVVEALFNYKYRNNLFSATNKKWLEDNGYIDENGEVNFSDRFTVVDSGTTPNVGNNGDTVSKSIKRGLVPEKKYPYPRLQRTPVFDLDEYYQAIPKELYDLQKEFAKRFDISAELVQLENMEEALAYSPIQIYIHAYGNEVNGILQRTTRGINHAVSKFELEYETYKTEFDHYGSNIYGGTQLDFIKKLAKDYIIYPYGYIYFISEKNNNMFKPNDNQLYLAIVDNSQYLAMGLNGKLVIYSQWAITDTQARARNKKLLDEGKIQEFLQKTNPITIDKIAFDSVIKVDGKGNQLTF